MKRRIPIEAFQFYVSLGAGRSYQAVADKYGVSKTAVVNCAEKEQWQERLVNVEREARQRSDQRAIETIEAMNARHLKTMQVIQGKALEALRVISLDSAIDAVRALDMSIRHERLIRGEPSERTAVSVEDTIRKHYERWMSEEEADDSSNYGGPCDGAQPDLDEDEQQEVTS